MPRHFQSYAELRAHALDIKIQAIEFYKAKDTLFPDQPRRERFRNCIMLVADIWFRLGPQSFEDGTIIYLP